MTDKEIGLIGDTSILGKQEIKVTYHEKNVTFTIDVTNDVIQILLKTKPNKIEYSLGEELDLAGGIILARYENDATEEILMTNENITIAGYNENIVGKQEINITYKGINTKFIINTTNNVTGIQISKIPYKTEYIVKEELDLTGGILLVTYQDGTKEEIPMVNSKVIVSGYDKTRIGNQNVTLEYLGFNIALNITIKPELPDIQVSISGEDKVIAGQTFTAKLSIETDGSYVNAVSGTLKYDPEISNIEIKEKNNWKITSFNKSTGEIQAVHTEGSTSTDIAEIKYTIKASATQQVNISMSDIKFITSNNDIISGDDISKESVINGKTERKLVNIEVSKKPNKRTYKEGEEVNNKGIVVKAKYSDGTSEVITNYKYTPLGSLKTKDDTVTIIYVDGDKVKTAEYNIVVKEKNNKNDNLNNNVNNNININTNNNSTNNMAEPSINNVLPNKNIEKNSLEIIIQNY